MESSLQEYLDQFIKKVLDLKEVKQYLLLKEEINASVEINKLQEMIKAAKKDLALSFATKEHQEKKEKYLALQSEYDNHPLIVNFNVVKEEVSYLLNKIEDSLKEK